MADLKHPLVNIFGNFGVSFFGPLMGTNAAQMLFNQTVEFKLMLVTSLVSALIVTGFSISYEASRYGKKR